jgi:hypothetical protein
MNGILFSTESSACDSFVAVSCFNFGYLSPALSAVMPAYLTSACNHNSSILQNPYSLGSQIYPGLTQIFLLVQLFVLGPRLILSVREYHAKRVAKSDAASGMTSISFQERVHVSTSSSV